MKIAVIAHDGKKAEMVAFLNRHMDFKIECTKQDVKTQQHDKNISGIGRKFVTLAYIPPTIAGMVLIYRGKHSFYHEFTTIE